MSIGFFNPALPTGFTVPSTWVLQSSSPSTSKNRAQGLKANGDEAAHQLYGGQTSTSLTFKVFETTGNIVPATFKIGGVSGGWNIDNISVAYTPTDWPTVTVSIHKHDDLATGATASHAGVSNVFTPSVTLPCGFGCPSGLRTAIGLGSDTSVGLSGFTYSMGVTHQDEMGDNGGWLAAENRDGAETISVSTVGVPSSAPAISGWDCTSTSIAEGNTAADTASYTLEHHVARDEEDDA